VRRKLSIFVNPFSNLFYGGKTARVNSTRGKKKHKLALPWLCLSVLGCHKIITRLITLLMSSDRALEGQLSQLGITEEPLKE